MPVAEDQSTANTAFVLESVRVTRGRLRLVLRWDPGSNMNVTPEFACEVLRTYPTITAHSCINRHGPTFGHALPHTNIPHVIEHMIIEEQLAMSSVEVPSFQAFVGTTDIDRDSGRAVIEVSFFDDIVALHSALTALNMANRLLDNN